MPCSIQKLEGPVEVYGYSVGEADDVTYVECGERCLQNAKCFSFAYNEINKKCFLKDQKHTSSSLLRSKNTKYFSAYLSGNCEKGIFSGFHFLDMGSSITNDVGIFINV